MNFGKILVVDNDETARFLLLRVMHRMKRPESVSFASSGEEALGMMEGEDFDLVLLDLHQPSVDGFEFLHALGQRRETTGKPLPRIVTLSSGSTDNAYSKARAGYLRIISAHLEKPFREKHILQLLGIEG